MTNQKGFSLTEVLVAVGVMGVLTAIASVSYNTYMGIGKKSAVKQDIQKLQNAFELCMSMNRYDITKCYDSTTPPTPATRAKSLEKVGFTAGTNIAKIEVVGNRACLGIQATVANNGTGERACAQYDNGRLTKKCFEDKEADPKTLTGCSGATAECCGGTKCGTTKPAECPVWPAPTPAPSG